MTDHYKDFPFEEIRRPDGNYFNSVAEVRAHGFKETQIWSVTHAEDDDTETITYGPSRHFVNVLGYIATTEHHDNETYYHEVWDLEDYE